MFYFLYRVLRLAYDILDKFVLILFFLLLLPIVPLIFIYEAGHSLDVEAFKERIRQLGGRK